MAVATDDRVLDGFSPIAVGLTVGFCALMAGPITGASMKSSSIARSCTDRRTLGAHWLYWIAPVTGMLAAARRPDEELLT